MKLQQLNGCYACSSLLLGDLGESSASGNMTNTPCFEGFKKKLLDAFKEMDNHKTDCWGNKGGAGFIFQEAEIDESDPYDTDVTHTGRTGTKFTSFVICSTTHRQSTVREHLEKLGFRPSRFDEEWNGKTNSRVQFYMIPTSLLLETLGHDGIYKA